VRVMAWVKSSRLIEVPPMKIWPRLQLVPSA
jgi:hypothetical protein